jgi:hypothetical protein
LLRPGAIGRGAASANQDESEQYDSSCAYLILVSRRFHCFASVIVSDAGSGFPTALVVGWFVAFAIAFVDGLS